MLTLEVNWNVRDGAARNGDLYLAGLPKANVNLAINCFVLFYPLVGPIDDLAPKIAWSKVFYLLILEQNLQPFVLDVLVTLVYFESLLPVSYDVS